MNILVLDGSPEGDLTGARVAGILKELFSERGWQTEHVVLSNRTLGSCTGCFQCWLKTPGLCVIDDDGRLLAGKFIQSDLVVLLTPVTFGVYSPELKRLLDRLIPNVSPFFSMVDGEMHHKRRYAAYPGILTIGWQEGQNETEERIFRNLSYRNSINFYSEKYGCGIIESTASEPDIRKHLKSLLPAVESAATGSPEKLPRFSISETGSPVRKALLLVGSPRMGKSTSASLGEYLLGRLRQKGVATETIHIYQVARNPEKTAKMLKAVDVADLALLAFPLYIDSLPAPVIAAMRQIHEYRHGRPVHGGLTAIANCGFIESTHNENALAACAAFASASGFHWTGGISIGGGEGLVHGHPLGELGGTVIPYRKNLDRVAESLAEGNPVPEEPCRQLAKPFVPAWIYRLFGSVNWKKQAHRHGVLRKLDDKPYQPQT